jgi:hypothetical protein
VDAVVHEERREPDSSLRLRQDERVRRRAAHQRRAARQADEQSVASALRAALRVSLREAWVEWAESSDEPQERRRAPEWPQAAPPDPRGSTWQDAAGKPLVASPA